MSEDDDDRLPAGSEQTTPPRVFISYSHDSQDHKRWVLELAEELAKNGVDPVIDAWDLRPGDDVPKFMEKGVRDSSRVLMICSEKYVAKANDGTGGVGYEAMIVTAELVRNLGTAKFVPIIRQSTDQPVVPTSVSTRLYINLSETSDRPSEMDKLLRDLHSIPPKKPTLGRPPYATINPPASGQTEAPTSLEAPQTIEESPAEPFQLYEAALAVAKSKDLLKWRRLISEARRTMLPALKTWKKSYEAKHPGDIDSLIDQSFEGVKAFAPLTAIALAGAASRENKFDNQVGLLEDILNPTEWGRGGMVVRVELPETGGFVYQALLGSMYMHVGKVRPAIDMVLVSTVNPKTAKSVHLWQRHDIVGWPESLGRNAIKSWTAALNLPSRWQWITGVFGDPSDYQAALYAYYTMMSFVEFATRVQGQFEIPENSAQAHWWPDVPVFFELTEQNIKRRGYRLILDERSAIRAWLNDTKIDEGRLRKEWPKWVSIQTKIFASERPFFEGPLGFANLVSDLLVA